VVVYICAQLAGALVGALLSWPLIGEDTAGYPALGANVTYGSAFLAELVVTFALCSVVLHTATTKAQANNSYYGLAIGFTVLSGAISVGPISGGAFNPAVGFMPVLYGDDAAADCWIYFAGPLLAGILAGLFFRICAVEDYTETPSKRQSDIACFLIETFGTMFLCFTVGTAAGGTSVLAPLSIGSALMVMVYMGGAVSGAHFNPAVTLALLLRTAFGPTHDEFALRRAAFYVPAQILGAALGTFFAWGVMGGNKFVGYPYYPWLPPEKGAGPGILGELLGTFLLAYVVLNVATVKNLAGNSFFGLAIGMVVTSMACAIGPITGGAFNPAVGLIGAFAGGANDLIGRIWIYWIGCPLGAALAAAFFRLQNHEEFQTDHEDLKFQAHAAHEPGKEKFMSHSNCRSRRNRAPQFADVLGKPKSMIEL